MQKAMEMMNIKLTGKTGTRIVQAIIAGEPNPERFLQFVDGLKSTKKNSA